MAVSIASFMKKAIFIRPVVFNVFSSNRPTMSDCILSMCIRVRLSLAPKASAIATTKPF